jgi:hypothetical protein
MYYHGLYEYDLMISLENDLMMGKFWWGSKERENKITWMS